MYYHFFDSLGAISVLFYVMEKRKRRIFVEEIRAWGEVSRLFYQEATQQFSGVVMARGGRVRIYVDQVASNLERYVGNIYDNVEMKRELKVDINNW